MKPNMFLILTIILIFSDCTFKSDEICLIDINPDGINKEMDINIKSFVQLDTSDSTLIGDINTLEFYENKYYVFDRFISKTLFLFDSTGKFLNKTYLGQGPGEVIEPWDFCINKFSKTVLIWDQSTFNLNVYDLYLSFIETIHCPGLAIRNISCIGDSAFLIFSQFYPVENGEVLEDKVYDFFIHKNNFNLLTHKLHPAYPNTRLITIDNAICKSDKKYFLAPLDNNIYELSEANEVSPICKFNLGKYQLTDNDLEKGIKFYRTAIKEGKRIGPLSNLFVNDRLISVSFSYKNKFEYYIFNRVMKYGFTSVDPNLKKMLPPCRIRGIDTDNTIIGIVDAMDFKNFFRNYSGILDVKGIDDFSNQIIIFFTIN